MFIRSFSIIEVGLEAWQKRVPVLYVQRKVTQARCDDSDDIVYDKGLTEGYKCMKVVH